MRYIPPSRRRAYGLYATHIIISEQRRAMLRGVCITRVCVSKEQHYGTFRPRAAAMSPYLLLMEIEEMRRESLYC